MMDPPALSDPISYTTVVTADLFTEVDIYTMFKVVKIDEFISGIKLKDRSRGFIKDTKSFYNQISLVVNEDGRALNVKIFVNGGLHISGAREDMITETKVVLRLAEYLNNLSGCYRTKICFENGLLVGEDNDFLYGKSASRGKNGETMYERVGIVRTIVKKRVEAFDSSPPEYARVITIKNKAITFLNGAYIVYDLGNKYKATIIDRLCQPIGEQRLILFDNRKNTPQSSGTILTKDGRLFNEKQTKMIGRYEQIYRRKEGQVPTSRRILVSYNIVKSKVDIDRVSLSCRNNNNKFEIDMMGVGNKRAHYIDRRELERVFETCGIKSASELESYHGSNTKLYYNQFKDGLCRCQVKSQCVCTRVSLNVFTTGRCLIMGAQTRQQIDWCWTFFRNILQEHYVRFYKPMVCDRKMKQHTTWKGEADYRLYIPEWARESKY